MNKTYALSALATAGYALLLSGCASGLFSYEPYADTKKGEHGNLMLADTPREWNDFVTNVDLKIKNEADGRPPSGFTSWNQHWNVMIRYIQDGHQENPAKYVSYIVEKRRQAGLPELVE